MLNSIIKEINQKGYSILGIILLFLLWQLISLCSHPLIVPSPKATFKALQDMFLQGELVSNLLISLKRQISGLTIGVVVGTLLGVLGGMEKRIHQLFLPLINTIMAVPSVIFVVLAMVWFGQGYKQVVFVVALLVFPVMYINSVKGIHTINNSLVEMAKVYRVPPLIKIKKLYLPGLSHGFLAGFTLSAPSSLRITVMAELFGSQEGMGQAIAITRNYLETDKLFAWALVLILLVFIMETLIFKPLEGNISKWQGRKNN